MFTVGRAIRPLKAITSVRFQWSQPQRKSSPFTQTISVPIFKHVLNFIEREAIQDNAGKYLYANLFLAAKELAIDISEKCGGRTDQRIIFLCPNDSSYLITQWAIWMSGQIAVPIASNLPETLLDHFFNDVSPKLVITDRLYVEQIHTIAKNTHVDVLVLDKDMRKKSMLKNIIESGDEGQHRTEFYNNKDALIIYTSGTTSKPKGVVLTHNNLTNQITTLMNAWKFDSKDSVLHTLPLNHIHGVVNGLLLPLYSGGKCILLSEFDVTEVWSRLVGRKDGDLRPNVFMGVPTMYVKLIEHYGKLTKTKKMIDHIHTTLKTRVRLMVSGSAPLPHSVHKQWETITGHKLLERYGMTEIGMCLSQKYESVREPGNVGVPLPGVSVRIAEKPIEDEGDYITLVEASNERDEVKINVKQLNDKDKDDPIGELQVKTPGMFREYFNLPHITEKEFTLDKWFKTGDICKYSREKKVFSILGRASVDIIKSGGYKVSAIEVESNLMNHPDVADCAVVGIEDSTYGQIVAALLVVKDKFNLDKFVEWTKSQLPTYSVPRIITIVNQLPKNSMGKVNKHEIIDLFIKKD